MCIKNTEKSFIKLQKQRIKFFFFLVVSNFTYGKNISDNEHQLIFSIHYSVFDIRIVESEQYYSYSVYFQKTNYSVFVKVSKMNIFGIRSIFTICCNSAVNPIPVGFRAANNNKGKMASGCQNDTHIHSTGIGLCILFQ